MIVKDDIIKTSNNRITTINHRILDYFTGTGKQLEGGYQCNGEEERRIEWLMNQFNKQISLCD